MYDSVLVVLYSALDEWVAVTIEVSDALNGEIKSFHGYKSAILAVRYKKNLKNSKNIYSKK